MQNGYRLNLADGQSWDLVHHGCCREWLEKFATILTLKSGSESVSGSKLVISKLDEPIRENNIHHPGAPLDIRRHGSNDHVRIDFSSLRIWLNRQCPDAECEIIHEQDHKTRIINMWNSLLPLYLKTVEREGIPLHAALIERDGAGVLLAAPGGTGKTTCCWRLPQPWMAMCDDEVLIVRGKDSFYYAHPFPTWSNHILNRSQRSWEVEKHVPLRAIFFLEQTKSDAVSALGHGNAAVLINQSATQVLGRAWDRMDRDVAYGSKSLAFQTAGNLAKEIPAYMLSVSKDGSFWENIDEILINNKADISD